MVTFWSATLATSLLTLMLAVAALAETVQLVEPAITNPVAAVVLLAARSIAVSSSSARDATSERSGPFTTAQMVFLPVVVLIGMLL